MIKIIRNKAFTLIETLVAVALMSVFFGGVYLVYNASLGSYRSSTNRAESVVACYVLYQQLIYDLKSMVCNRDHFPEIKSEDGGVQNVLEFQVLLKDLSGNKPQMKSIKYVFNAIKRTVTRNDELVSQGKFEQVKFAVNMTQESDMPDDPPAGKYPENNVHFKITSMGSHTALTVDTGSEKERDARKRTTLIGSVGIPSRTQFNEIPWYVNNATSEYIQE